MPLPPNVVLTPAQLAKQAERKAAKLAKRAASEAAGNKVDPAEVERRRILQRSWVPLGGTAEGKRTARIVTWNMLAQTLVRRDLFPGSDCLRWGDRKPMLQAEMATHADVDVICLQECDRLDDMLSSVPSHKHVETKGPGKLHGLVILYKASRFSPKVTQALPLDDEELSPDADTSVARRGVSRQTRNMGLITALEENGKGDGIVVVTTHLFWHPKFMYERTRQVIVLLRAVRKLQKEHGIESWPIVFAGDLNTEPDESTYQMLVNPKGTLHQHLVDSFNVSRLVHTNVANVGKAPSPSEPPSESASGTATPVPAPADDDKDEEELPDTDERSIANTRAPNPEDGIRTLDEMMEIGRGLMLDGARSAYGNNTWGAEETFATRGGFPEGVTGAGGGEPAYTCFTPKFHLTLDYLFLVPSPNAPMPEFTSLLAMPPTEALGAGLPRKGVSASDHLPIGCEIVW